MLGDFGAKPAPQYPQDEAGRSVLTVAAGGAEDIEFAVDADQLAAADRAHGLQACILVPLHSLLLLLQRVAELARCLVGWLAG